MNELLCDTLWPTIKRLAKKAAVKRAAVAYVTTEAFVKFGEGDILVTDASDHAISSAQTSAKVLARAFKRGAKLFSLSGLHTKVLLLDGTAVIGSANLSENSPDKRVEASWVTDNPAAVGMAASLVQQLSDSPQAIQITAAFLKRILKIKVKRTGWAQGKKPGTVRIPKHRTWIMGVYELTRDYEEEQAAIDAGTETAKGQLTRKSSDVSWIRLTGDSRFKREARDGHTIIQIWSGPNAKRPDCVYRHTPILRRQAERTCTRFFVEEFADYEETSLSWGTFKKLAKRVGLPPNLGPSSARLIPEAQANALFALWNE